MLKKILGGILLALVQLQDAMAATSTCLASILPSAAWGQMAVSSRWSVCVSWCKSQNCTGGTSATSGGCYSGSLCSCAGCTTGGGGTGGNSSVSSLYGSACGTNFSSFSNFSYMLAGSYNQSGSCVYSVAAFQCKPLYYGTYAVSLFSLALLSTYLASMAATCKPCPTSGAYSISGNGLGPANNACWLVSGQSHSDTTGKWTYTTNCYYSS